jgi:macrolide-specific efflux system membrane fusion protein
MSFLKKKKIVVSLLVLAIAGGTTAFLMKKDRKHEISYKKLTVQRGDLSVTVLSTGTVEPENRLNIQAPIAGRVETVLVDQGFTVKKGQVLAWVSSTERAALLDSAHSVGPEEVKKWEELYKPTPVLAPVSGMIIQRNIQPGQTFATTDAILVMSDHLIVQAQVDETDIAQIQLKQAASIVLDAYPEIPGHVDQIAYDAKTVNNVTTYEVDVLPEAVPPFMRSGMTANVSFPVGSKTGVIFVPADSIKTKDGRPYVFVPPESGSEPIRRDVSLGISDGKRVEIVAGLNEGDAILEPEFKLGPRMKQATTPFSGPQGTPGGGRR